MSKSILERWLRLRDGDGLSAAQQAARWLWVLGLGLFLVVSYGLFTGRLPPWLMVSLSIPFGWLIAERNALEWRCRQWPTFRRYLDWPRIEADLASYDTPLLARVVERHPSGDYRVQLESGESLTALVHRPKFTRELPAGTKVLVRRSDVELCRMLELAEDK
jgi:hypothetical protein